MKTESIKSTDRYYPVGAGRFCCAENQPLFHTNSNSFLIMYIVDGAFTFVKNGMQISAHVGDMLYCDNPSALQSDMNSRGELIWMQIGGVDYFELIQKNKGITKCKNTASEKKLFLHIYDSITDSNLNHTGIYLYSKGKIMIHLTFDYKTDEKCTTPGQYLKYHRTFQGLTTRELAEKVGIVPATLVLYENDRHPIKHDIAVALANTLGIDRNRLLDEYTTFVDYPYSSLLKKVRHELSLTQMQMAEVIGIGQTTYSGWEREARVPRRKEHDKILAALKKLKVNVDTYLCQSTSI